MTEINMDALAESHYAKYDPQFEEETEEDKKAKNMEWYLRLNKELSSVLDHVLKQAESDGVNLSDFVKENKDIITDDLYAEMEGYE